MLKKRAFVLAKYKVVNGNPKYELVNLIEEATVISKLKEKDSVKSYMMADILKDYRYLNDKSTRSQVDKIFFTFEYQDLIKLAVNVFKSTYGYNERDTMIFKYNLVLNDNRYKYNDEAKKEIIKNIVKHMPISNLDMLIKFKVSLVKEHYFVQGMADVFVEKENYDAMLKLITNNMEMFDKNDSRKFVKLALVNYKYNTDSFYKRNPSLQYPYFPFIYIKGRRRTTKGKYVYTDEDDDVIIPSFFDTNIVLDKRDKRNEYYRYVYFLIIEEEDNYTFVWEHFEKNDKRRRIYINKIIRSYEVIYNADFMLALEFLIYDLGQLVYMITEDTHHRKGWRQMEKTKKKIEEDIKYLEEMVKEEEKYKFKGEGYVESIKDYIKRLTKK